MLYIAALSQVERLHLATFWASLRSNERITQHVIGGFLRGFGSFDHFNATLITIGESSFTAATRVDLGLHYDHFVAKLGESGFNFDGIRSRVTAWDGNPVFLKKVFSLILVDVHLFIRWCV